MPKANFKLLHLAFFCSTAAIFLFSGCKTSYQPVGSKHTLYKVKADSSAAYHQKVYQTILPYKQKLDSSMSEVLIYAENDFVKKTPCGSLGSMFCDVLMGYMQNNHTDFKIDFCLLNNGGLRIPFIAKGAITTNTAFELMPFENELVILELSAEQCQQLFNDIANSGGAPVSGVTFNIENKTARQILIGNLPLNPNKNYYLLTSDYLANGGDKAEVLTNALSKKTLNTKIRDAFILQLRHMNSKGLTLKAPTDERITN